VRPRRCSLHWARPGSSPSVYAFAVGIDAIAIRINEGTALPYKNVWVGKYRREGCELSPTRS
jgi:hypothetical protein